VCLHACDGTDPFHEVKRKRDKKKDVSDLRSPVLSWCSRGVGRRGVDCRGGL
jgi:hypothetical protein